MDWYFCKTKLFYICPMQTPLIDNHYRLEKFAGKGGWTYASIPEVLQDPHSPFGWVKVRGSIDGHIFEHTHLMPMGNGTLFLPVKAAVRKKIGKQAGDTVHIILYKEDRVLETPEEIRICLANEPLAELRYYKLTEGEQKAYLDWIYDARKEETKIERISGMIERLVRGVTLYDKVIKD